MSGVGRIPPNSQDAERSVLGAILIDKEVFFEISGKLKSEDFYNAQHGEIYEAMLDLFRRNQPIDVVTVNDCLKKRGSLNAVGGMSYLVELSTLVPTTANAVQYARIVSEKSDLRKLIRASGDIVEKCYGEKLDPQDVLDYAETAIYEVAKTKQRNEYIEIQKVLAINLQLIDEAQKSGGKLPGLPTHFTDLDNVISGLQKSDLIILAARPSMGKTALALNIAQNAALKSDSRVVIFSLEMAKEQLGIRLLSTQARIDSKKLRVGDLNEDDWKDVMEAVEMMSKADIIIDDTPGIGVMEIRNKCRRINQQRKIDLIVIDYLQIMSADSRSESRQQEVSTISRYLKQLAREMECPVLVLSQLSRASEKASKTPRRPILSDLRNSGAIEQDADVVIFLHRDDYYKQEGEELDNTAEVIVAKQRMGETKPVYLTWLPKYTKFANRLRETKK